MLIRRPAAEVFGAFVDPAITTRFWFTRSTGRLAQGAKVTWYWDMYQHQTAVQVVRLVENQEIEILWGAAGGSRLRVQWLFEAYGPDATFVTIRMDGFRGSEAEILKQVSGTVEGFCWVLAGLKTYLEQGIEPHFVADRFPEKTSLS